MTRRPIPIKITDQAVELGADGYALNLSQAIEHGTLEFSRDGIWCTLIMKVEPPERGAFAELDVDRVTIARDTSIVDTLTAFEIERAAIDGTTGTVWENILSFLRTRARLDN